MSSIQTWVAFYWDKYFKSLGVSRGGRVRRVGRPVRAPTLLGRQQGVEKNKIKSSF